MAGGTGQGGDAFRRPASSELPEIPITAYLAMLQATELALSSRNGIQRQGAFREQTTGIINIVNSTGADLELYSIVGLDAPMNLPDSEAGGGDPFQVEPIYFRATAPDILVNCGQFAIVIEPIEADGCGRACVAGICRVKITVPDEDTERRWADIIDAEYRKLAAAHRGSAEILWREGGTGEQWAIVRLGSHSPSVFPAKITGAAILGESNYRWKYAWEEVVDDGDDIITVTNGRSGTTTDNYALNDFERFHTSTIAGGVALDGDDYPAGFAPMPIGGAGPLSSGDGIWRYSVVVQMQERWDAANSQWVYRFSSPISHDGTCEAAT